MISKVLIATGLALVFALPAAAQSQSNKSSGSGEQNAATSQHQGGQNSMNIRQHLAQQLQQAGFTDVHVMPESFLVRAKDKQGEPVMMVINPDSVTAVTEVSGAGQSSSGNSGSSGSKTQ